MRRATRELGDLGVLIRLFLLADDCPAGDVAAALAPLTIAQCVDAGLLEGENFDSENPRSCGPRWIFAPSTSATAIVG